MSKEQTKYLMAPRGFSANGITMTEGEYLTNQFDEQTVKVLKGMGRLVETDVAPSDVDDAVTAKGKKTGDNRSVGLPGGLPGGPAT